MATLPKSQNTYQRTLVLEPYSIVVIITPLERTFASALHGVIVTPQ
jgi:hypothetical protein